MLLKLFLVLNNLGLVYMLICFPFTNIFYIDNMNKDLF